MALTAEQMEALSAELRGDPLAIGYVKLEPEDVLASLVGPTRERIVPRMVTARTVLAECKGGAQLLDRIEAIGGSVSEVKWAMHFLKGNEGIDAGHAVTRALIESLSDAKALTREEADSLLRLAMQPCSRLDELGLPEPIIAEVIEAAK